MSFFIPPSVCLSIFLSASYKTNLFLLGFLPPYPHIAQGVNSSLLPRQGEGPELKVFIKKSRGCGKNLRQ